VRAGAVRLSQSNYCPAHGSPNHGVKKRPHSGERNGDVTNGVPSPEYGQIKWFSASPRTCSREGFPSDTCVSFQILAKEF